MTALARDAMRKVALRVYKDATAASVEDARKMAKALLLLIDGRLP